MALVSYDYGSSDSEDHEDDEKQSEKIENGQVEIIKTTPFLNGSDDSTSKSITFDKLPKTKEINAIEEDEVEDFVPKAPVLKEKPKVKITIPSLSDFDDLETSEPIAKKLKPSAKGSGLLSLLPPVKCEPISAKTFVPNVLQQKNKSATKAKLNPKTIPKKPIKKPVKIHTGSESDTDNEDFELPETFDDDMWKKVCGRQEKKVIIENKKEEIIEPEYNAAPETSEPYDGLNNEAFKELVGSRKRIPGNIKLIDINEEEILPEKDLWMTKSLTDPEYIPKKEIEDPVDPTRRKKHHITYLAQQAKANEQDLKNQWADRKSVV